MTDATNAGRLGPPLSLAPVHADARLARRRAARHRARPRATSSSTPTAAATSTASRRCGATCTATATASSTPRCARSSSGSRTRRCSGSPTCPSIELAERLVADRAARADARLLLRRGRDRRRGRAQDRASSTSSSAAAPRRTRFVALVEAYHGDTLGAVGVGGIELFHQIFQPAALFHVAARSLAAPIDPSALGRSARRREHGATSSPRFIVEPLVQGAAGMWMQPPGYLRAARELCTPPRRAPHLRRGGDRLRPHRDDVRLRAGGITPDLLCLAKGITGGYLPLAATLATEEIFERSSALRGRTRLLPRPHLHRQSARLRRRRSPASTSSSASACSSALQPKIARLRARLAERDRAARATSATSASAASWSASSWCATAPRAPYATRGASARACARGARARRHPAAARQRRRADAAALHHRRRARPPGRRRRATRSSRSAAHERPLRHRHRHRRRQDLRRLRAARGAAARARPARAP